VRAALPLSADRVLHRIRETRGGRLYDPRFGARGRGEGTYALAIETLFRATARRLGFVRHGEAMREAGSGEGSARDVDVDVRGAQLALGLDV